MISVMPGCSEPSLVLTTVTFCTMVPWLMSVALPLTPAQAARVAQAAAMALRPNAFRMFMVIDSLWRQGADAP